ncbi:MAG: hypothetical protein CMA07_00035 [Euryarchaeota archaeon]|nr:hypothetical protein [Euryarchaeota archaeon]
MKKLESSKTTGGLYYNKFCEFLAKGIRFKKNNKNELNVKDTTSRIDGREDLTDDSTTPKSEES